MEQKDFFIETFYKEDGEVAPFGFTLGSPWFAAMKETTKPMIRRDAFIALGDGQRPKAGEVVWRTGAKEVWVRMSPDEIRWHGDAECSAIVCHSL